MKFSNNSIIKDDRRHNDSQSARRNINAGWSVSSIANSDCKGFQRGEDNEDHSPKSITFDNNSSIASQNISNRLPQLPRVSYRNNELELSKAMEEYSMGEKNKKLAAGMQESLSGRLDPRQFF